MKLIRSLAARPALATAVTALVIAVALLAVPISCVRMVGYEATLSVAGIDATRAVDIANEFGKVLKTRADYDRAPDASGQVVFKARIPEGSRRLAQGLCMAYAQSLAMRGLSARTNLLPIREKVSGNVYAAVSRIFEVHVQSDGKTNEQIAQEIRDQLAAAGLPGANVEVTQEGGRMQMRMTWEAPPGECIAGIAAIFFRGGSTHVQPAGYPPCSSGARERRFRFRNRPAPDPVPDVLPVAAGPRGRLGPAGADLVRSRGRRHRCAGAVEPLRQVPRPREHGRYLGPRLCGGRRDLVPRSDRRTVGAGPAALLRSGRLARAADRLFRESHPGRLGGRPDGADRTLDAEL